MFLFVSASVPKMYIVAVKGQHFFTQTHLFACKGQRFLEKMYD
jgi:hypothetical protein